MAEGWEIESLVLFVISPALCVLASVIGCEIMDSKGHKGYTPTDAAARLGAIGGPVAAIICIFISATLTDESALTAEEIEELIAAGQPYGRMRRFYDRSMSSLRTGWGFVAPYVICVVGPPVGSGIMRAAKLGDDITPLKAVRAGAIGGLFAVPIYFIAVFLINAISNRIIARYYDGADDYPGGPMGGGSGPGGFRRSTEYSMRERDAARHRDFAMNRELEQEMEAADGTTREQLEHEEAIAREELLKAQRATERLDREADHLAREEAMQREDAMMREEQLAREEEEMAREEALHDDLYAREGPRHALPGEEGSRQGTPGVHLRYVPRRPMPPGEYRMQRPVPTYGSYRLPPPSAVRRM